MYLLGDPGAWSTVLLVLVYTQEGSLWSIVPRCDDHTGIFTCDGCARDPYFYVPAETQMSSPLIIFITGCNL